VSVSVSSIVTEYRTILDRFDGALYECFDYFMHHLSGIPNELTISVQGSFKN